MGCTVVFLFGAVLLLFGLHYGVQLDRIGAWARAGVREGGSKCIGQVSFYLLLLRSHATALPFLLSLSLSRHILVLDNPPPSAKGKASPPQLQNPTDPRSNQPTANGT